MKKRLRTFHVKESFTDPYTGQIHFPDTKIEENDLLDSGWAQTDIDNAIPSLLVPKLWPDPKEVDDGERNST